MRNLFAVLAVIATFAGGAVAFNAVTASTAAACSPNSWTTHVLKKAPLA